jgi:alginate O-acetyltransferase complex protein AlgI
MGLLTAPALGACLLILAIARLSRNRPTGSHGLVWLTAVVSAAVIALWQPLALVVTVALTALTQLAVRHRRNRAIGAAVIAGLVAALVGFKYVPWITELLGGPAPAWVFPLGLSFTVFRLIGVVLDGRALPGEIPGRHLWLLSLFFPTFLAGPITTVRSLARDEERSISAAIGRIWVGLFRKIVLADPLNTLVIAPWVGAGVAHLEPYQCLVLPVLFGLYIYWDFAGYTDMAIGLGGLMGFRVPENFDRPYTSQSLVDFWRRWHITLSEWIRMRLMMKMVGRRSPESHMYAAIVVSMAICGLWHGAGSNFLLWGVWHGLGLVGVHVFGRAQRRFGMLRAAAERVLRPPVSIVLTFVYVSLGWLVFFLPVSDAFVVARRAAAYLPDTAPAIAWPAGLLAWLLVSSLVRDRAPRTWWRIPRVARQGAMCVGWGVICYLLLFARLGSQEFVYTQF